MARRRLEGDRTMVGVTLPSDSQHSARQAGSRILVSLRWRGGLGMAIHVASPPLPADSLQFRLMEGGEFKCRQSFRT